MTNDQSDHGLTITPVDDEPEPELPRGMGGTVHRRTAKGFYATTLAGGIAGATGAADMSLALSGAVLLAAAALGYWAFWQLPDAQDIVAAAWEEQQSSHQTPAESPQEVRQG